MDAGRRAAVRSVVCVNTFVPKLHLLPAALSDDSQQQPDDGRDQEAEQQTDPHVAPRDPDLR